MVCGSKSTDPSYWKSSTGHTISLTTKRDCHQTLAVWCHYLTTTSVWICSNSCLPLNWQMQIIYKNTIVSKLPWNRCYLHVQKSTPVCETANRTMELSIFSHRVSSQIKHFTSEQKFPSCGLPLSPVWLPDLFNSPLQPLFWLYSFICAQSAQL